MIPKTTERNFLNFLIGADNPFFVIAGPCVIESRELVFEIAEELKELEDKFNILVLFKASFDKANRSSASSYRGPGLEKGLKILADVKQEFGLPVITDIHESRQALPVGEVANVIQIPAYLCRQTDLIKASSEACKYINVKKGQFLAPQDVPLIVEKANNFGSKICFITERGYTFGYNNLVVDPRSFEVMRIKDIPVIFDATHSVQSPGGGTTSGGKREFIPVQARAAVASGIEGLFFEVHPDPDSALSDASNMLKLKQFGELLKNLLDIDAVVKGR